MDRLYYDKRGKYRPKPFLRPAVNIGDTVSIAGRKRRVSAVSMKIAEEPDPEMGIEVGDWTYDVEID